MHVGPGNGELTEHVNQPPPPPSSKPWSHPSPRRRLRLNTIVCIYAFLLVKSEAGGGCSVGNPPTRESFPHINVRAAQR